MRPEDLQAFLVILEHGNLGHAAQVCGVSQSALSKTVARLEQAAGLALLERTARGVAPSAAGLRLAEHARRVTVAMRELACDMHEQRIGRAGQVRLGVIPHLMSGLVSPLLASFFGSRPLATFSIETHLSARLLRMLDNGEVDLVLAARPDNTVDGFDCAALPPLVIQIVASARHPRLHRLARLDDLIEERWAVPSASVLRLRLETHLAQAGLPPPQVAVESSASPTGFAELLRSTELIGIMPQRALRQTVGQGLSALDFAGSNWSHELAVYWRRDGVLGPMARDFRDALLEQAHALPA
ncbi:LysR family transcriptional regulator [Verticiella sediminum]|uniref:LysR family transcriptional regulator n=1 Tax=Verticiella sediminum TaxID=1247510 RepID=A0A556AVB8_9BURK|nr:LysR family transcriptional regulator [Verticiella sediminum]TSH96898.1 LysR family transcriptional regulator [Verticiella sediminum]